MRNLSYVMWICVCSIIGIESQEHGCISTQPNELLKTTDHYVAGEIQAIVPGMRFNCSGKITRWKMGFSQTHFDPSVKSYKLQVWRYHSNGMYQLLGSNEIPTNESTELPQMLTHNVPESRQITFSVGDIVGFYISTDNSTLLFESTDTGGDVVLYTSISSGEQLCTFDTKCSGEIVKMRQLPQIQVEYESITSMGSNNYALCHHWSNFYSDDCQRLQLDDPINDHIPTETSGTSDGPSSSVTNTADGSTSKTSKAVIIAASISGVVIIFLLVIITMIVIVCVRKRRQQSISDHLIQGLVGLDIKSTCTDTPKHQPLNYYSEDKIIEHIISGKGLQEKDDGWKEDDYIVMTSFLGDTYEKINRIGSLKKENLNQEDSVVRRQPKDTPKKSDQTMSKAINEWINNTNITIIPKENIKFLAQIRICNNTVVHKAVLEMDEEKREVAVRELQKNTRKTEAIRYMQEVAVLTQLHHPSIVEFYGIVESENLRMVVVELGTHGNLEEFLDEQTEITRKSQSMPVQLQELLKLFSKQIATGMNYVHNKGFAHGNLEARHVIITTQKQCKITGLSVMCSVCPRDMMSYLPSSAKMQLPPPEVAEDGRFSKASDVWSYGTILYQMWGTGHKPRDKLETAYNELLYSGSTSEAIIPELPDSLPLINKIVQDCWQLNPTKRPTFSDVVTRISELDTDYCDV